MMIAPLRLLTSSLISLLVLCSVSVVRACSSNRPGWANHRTLYVPSWMMSNPTNNDRAWMDALCCLYTHVQMGGNNARLEIFDGSSYGLRTGSSFADLASRTMDDVCAMSMGREDCSRQRQCVNNAFRWTPQQPAMPVRMCNLRDKCAMSNSVQSCRSEGCCWWNTMYGCLARRNRQCYPWQQVPCV